MKTDLPGAIFDAIRGELKHVHTAIPGVIESYSATKRKASVRPTINIKLEDNTVLKMPVITNVPVVFPSSSAVSITWPLQKGDGVLIIFSEASLENWLSLASGVDETDPRRFALSDAIAIPGLFNFKTVTTGSTDGLLLDAPSITLNKSGAKEVARKGDATLAQTGDSVENAKLFALLAAAATLVGLPAPTSITSKITGGSTTVKAGD